MEDVAAVREGHHLTDLPKHMQPAAEVMPRVGPLGEQFRSLATRPELLSNADLITMWGLTIIGVCLMLGLFTRLASLAGIGFILMFYLAAPPFIGYSYSIPSEGSYLIVNKNLVEVGALAVIMLTGSGRFAGLDRIVLGLIRRRPRLAAA